MNDGEVTVGENVLYAFTFRIDGDLRFLSHHDTMRLFRRALARAALPVRFSQGFNPHPRMTLPLPRPVGIASEAERIVIEFDEPLDEQDVLDRLRAQMPYGLTVTAIRRISRQEKEQPHLVTYRLEPAGETIPDLKNRIAHLMESPSLIVTRTSPKDKVVRTIDLRPYVKEVRLADQAVEFTLVVTGNGTARPGEIAGLLGYEAKSINHRIRRLEVQWQ